MRSNKLAKDGSREFNTWCKLVIIYAKEVKKNNSRLNGFILKTALRHVWMLSTPLKNKIQASKKAYDEFKALTGDDIRNYDRDDYALPKTGKRFKIVSKFTFEHLTTVEDFTKEVLSAAKLNKKVLKNLIKKQYVCWVTKDEDERLRKSGCSRTRKAPFAAYEACKITLKIEN